MEVWRKGAVLIVDHSQVVRVRDLSKTFVQGRARHRVLSHVSLEIRKREIVGLIGPNGAGKTTLLHTILGLLKADSGEVAVFGHDPIENRNAVVPKVGAVMDGNRTLFMPLTVRQNLIYFAYLKNIPKELALQRIHMWVERTEIASLLEKKCYKLSRGQIQRLKLVIALLSEPEFLVLDEPTAGLDDQSISALSKYIQDDGERRTYLIASHQLNWLERLAHRVYVLCDGHIIQPPNEHATVLPPLFRWTVSGHVDTRLVETLEKNGATLISLPGNLWEIQFKGDDFLSVFAVLQQSQLDVHEFKNERLTLQGLYRHVIEEEGRRALTALERKQPEAEDDNHFPTCPTDMGGNVI